MTKQIVPLNVNHKPTKMKKKHTPIIKLRKGKIEYILYDTVEKRTRMGITAGSSSCRFC